MASRERNARALARLSAANPVPDHAVRGIVAESWSDDLLDRVLGQPDAADEAASLSRPRRQDRGRRRSVPQLAFLGAAVLVAILVAAPALGLPQRLIKLFSRGEPAPARTELAFSTLDQGAPAGMATGVIPGTARKAFDVALPQGGQATLWVAPTRHAGFCEMLELTDAGGLPRGAGGPGCDDRANVTGYSVTIPGSVGQQGIERGPVVVSGYANIRDATTAVIRFQDGTEARIQLTWISEPIDAAFFVYGVPPTHWDAGRRPNHLRYVDADGKVVGEHAIRLGPLGEGSRRS